MMLRVPPRSLLELAVAVWISAACASALSAQEQLRYDREYPSIPYSSGKLSDPVARFFDALSPASNPLHAEDPRGYLASFIQALGIPVESQTLVFTRTSFLKGLIGPKTPRAIYFGDEVYAAWVPGSDHVEIEAVDPLLGAVFYTLKAEQGKPKLERHMGTCLQCHDSFGLTGDGVPELLIGSMLPDDEGNAVYHEGWMETSHETPLKLRWGGWYVTGSTGSQVHMGNTIVTNPARVELKGGTVTDLSDSFDTSRYLTGSSDVVALMLLEHQVAVQNQIINVNYRVRTALHKEGVNAAATRGFSADTESLIEEVGEPLVRLLFFTGEAKLTAPIRGNTAFAARFAARGPFDAQGRSLRQLDLTRRMFKYPLSYLVYSQAFDGLPVAAKAYVYRRVGEILSGQDRTPAFSHLSAADRSAIKEILQATKPELAAGVVAGYVGGDRGPIP